MSLQIVPIYKNCLLPSEVLSSLRKSWIIFLEDILSHSQDIVFPICWPMQVTDIEGESLSRRKLIIELKWKWKRVSSRIERLFHKRQKEPQNWPLYLFPSVEHWVWGHCHTWSAIDESWSFPGLRLLCEVCLRSSPFCTTETRISHERTREEMTHKSDISNFPGK